MTKEKRPAGYEREIPIELIDRPKRVSRFDIPDDEIDELAESIRERGLLQAITVAERDGRFEVVFGDRRFLACKKLGFASIRGAVRKYSELDIAIDRATENGQRANLSPLEEAAEYVNIHETHGLTWEQIGKMLGKSGGLIVRRVRVLKMHDKIQKAIHEKKISLGVAEELHRCPDQTHALYLLEMCVDHGVTVAVVRDWVNDFVSAVRRGASDVEGGGGEFSVYEGQPIFRACALCRGPVDLMKIKHLETCPECFEAILKIVREGG